MDNLIDARGKICPMPIIALRKALDEFGTRYFCLILNDEISYLNVKRYLEEKAIPFATKKNGKDVTFYINQIPNSQLFSQVKNQQERDKRITKGATICLKTQIMGEGDKDLGTLLMSAFINNLKNCNSFPEFIVCYNSGAILCTQTSTVISTLKELEKNGVQILICGVCIEYFRIKDVISVGKISNMHEISEIMLNSKIIIYP